MTKQFGTSWFFFLYTSLSYADCLRGLVLDKPSDKVTVLQNDRNVTVYVKHTVLLLLTVDCASACTCAADRKLNWRVAECFATNKTIMSLKKFDTELQVWSCVSVILCIPAASCLRSPDFLHGVSDERLIRMCFSGFRILWKRLSNDMFRNIINLAINCLLSLVRRFHFP